MSPGEVELYKDIAKIGIPALLEMLSGLIPYYFERSKLSDSTRREKLQFQRSQIIELIEAFSRFSGNFRAYTSLLSSRELNPIEDFGEKIFSYAEKMLSHEVDLTRAKAIAGLLGKQELVQKLTEYDQQASTLVSVLATANKNAKESVSVEIEKLKYAENEVFNCLKALI